jgi:hypothetical protein
MSLKRIIAVCTFLVICATFFRTFLPRIISVGWHVLHGNSVQLGVWKIPVPWGWQVLNFKESKDSVVMGKIEKGIPDDDLVSHLLLGNLNLPVGAVIEREKWKEASIENSLKSGYRFTSESEVQMDGESGFCFTFAGINHPRRLWIDCVFPIHRLSIQYTGTKANAQILDSIIQHIRASR